MTSRAALLVAPVAAATLLVPSVADAQVNPINTFYLFEGPNPSTPLTALPAFGANGSGSVNFRAQSGAGRGFYAKIEYGLGASDGIFLIHGGNVYGGQEIAGTRPQAGTRYFQTHVSHGLGVAIRKLGNGVNIAGAIGTYRGADHSGVIAKGIVTAYGTGVRAGGFAPVGPNAHVSGYIGLRANGYDGWLKVKVTNNAEGVPTSLEFVKASDGLYGEVGDSNAASYAFYGVIGDSLTTPSAIPEPASVPGGLSLLALGAAGVREMRRRRKLAV